MVASVPVTSDPAAYCATSPAANPAMAVVTKDVVARGIVGTSGVKTVMKARWKLSVSSRNSARTADVVSLVLQSFRIARRTLPLMLLCRAGQVLVNLGPLASLPHTENSGA